ncbi:MAG: dockerin type I domain-containing protein, partial [Planctomycetota bacterium]
LVDNETRGWYLSTPGTYQSDRAEETADEQTLLGLAGPGAELTFTLVAVGTEQRLGVDRDGDGFFDRDELDAGSDPANGDSTPDNVLVGDINGDGLVDVSDFLLLLAAWGPCPDPCPPTCAADLDGDCAVTVTDFLLLLANWS